MKNLRDRAEAVLALLTDFIIRHPCKVLFLFLSLSAASAASLNFLAVDTSFEGMLHEDDPVRVTYDQFRERYGQDRIIIVAVHADNIFSDMTLDAIRSLHRDLEDRVPYVFRVESLINARHTYGEENTLYVDDLLKNWPVSEKEFNDVKEFALANPWYRNFILSEDGRTAAIIVETEGLIDGHGNAGKKRFTEVEIREVANAVHDVVQPYKERGMQIAVTGGPIIDAAFDRIATEDMELLGVLALGVAVLFQALLLRRVSGVILPNIVVYGALLHTLAIMVLLGFPITVFTSLITTLLVAVGTATSMHLLVLFYRYYDSGDDKNTSVVRAVRHSGLAVIMTSLTTAIGFLSFSTAELNAVGQMGIVSAIGTILAMLCTLLVMPALIVLLPIRRKAGFSDAEDGMSVLLAGVSRLGTGRPKTVTIVGLAILAVSIVLASQVRFYHSMMEDLPDTLSEKRDLADIEASLGGSITVEALIDTHMADGIKNPAILVAIDEATARIGQLSTPDIYVGKIVSIVDVIKEINQALFDNDSNQYRIPDSRELVAQEIFLFESTGSEDLDRLVNADFSETRVTIKIPWAELFATGRFLDDVARILQEELPDGTTFTLTGMSSLMGRVFPAAITSMRDSYVSAFVTISLVMCLVAGSIRMGLIAMIPNLTPLAMGLAAMTLASTPLNLGALLFASIAIGLVVDDTIHFIYRFQRYYQQYGCPEKASERTLVTSGRAMLFTSLVLSASFFAMSFATLEASSTLGVLVGMIILFALVADLMMMPAIMKIVVDKGLIQLGTRAEQPIPGRLGAD